MGLRVWGSFEAQSVRGWLPQVPVGNFRNSLFRWEERPTSKPENRKFRLFAGFLVCAVCLASAHQAFGQATTSAISGTVQDVQGGMVAGATVTVRNLDTNLTRTLVTESDGRFRFPGLAIGPYELTVEHTGFARYVWRRVQESRSLGCQCTYSGLPDISNNAGPVSLAQKFQQLPSRTETQLYAGINFFNPAFELVFRWLRFRS